MSSQFSLRWNNYINHITYAFESLRSHEDLVDVTLCCEGRKIRAHKILLSACSTYFKDVFKENPCQHPVIIFKNVKYEDLLAIIEFMYQGEVNVQQESLSSFLHTAEMLNVQGLTDTTNPDALIVKDNNIMTPIGPTTKNSKIQPDIKSVSMTTQTYPIVTQNQTNEFILTKPAANIVIKSRTFSEKTDMELEEYGDNTDFACIKKRRISQEPEPDDDDQHVDEDIYEECGDGDGELQQSADNVLNDESTSHFLKVELPDYIDIDHEPESNQLKQTISMTDQSSEQEKSLVKYKQIEDENEIELIYQDSESEQRDTSEMERLYATQESTESGQHTTGLTTAQDNVSKWSQCRHCSLVLTTANLWRHIRTQHTEQPPRQCDYCKKKFKNKYSLREHVRIAHERQTSNVSKHYQTVSTLECDLCQRKFTSVSALKRHKESKHTETRVVYTCQPCAKSFKTKWSLSTHTSRFHRNKQMVLIDTKDDLDVGIHDMKTEYLR